MSEITMKQCGIVDLAVDAIVNAANSGLHEGGGVCGVIFKKAGSREMTAACGKYDGCPTGSAVITPGFNLPSKYCIHAVGPIWNQANADRCKKQLYGAYQTSLALAKENGCRSIAFPLISAGIFGMPSDIAWRKALQACTDFIANNPDYNIDIIFTIPSDVLLSEGQEMLAAMKQDQADAQSAAGQPESAADTSVEPVAEVTEAKTVEATESEAVEAIEPEKIEQNRTVKGGTKMNRLMKVTGRGRVSLTPDLMRVRLKVSGSEKEYDETVKASAEKSEELRAALVKLGFAGKDLKTEHFDIEPWKESYHDQDGNWKERFRGYRFTHRMKLEFAYDNALLGKVLYAIAHSGEEPDFSIEFTVADREAAKNELLANAVKDSRSKAAVLAAAAGVGLGEIVNIDYSWGEIDFVSRPVEEMGLMKTMAAPIDNGAYDMDIEAEDIDVTDTVTIVWEMI